MQADSQLRLQQPSQSKLCPAFLVTPLVLLIKRVASLAKHLVFLVKHLVILVKLLVLLTTPLVFPATLSVMLAKLLVFLILVRLLEFMTGLPPLVLAQAIQVLNRLCLIEGPLPLGLQS